MLERRATRPASEPIVPAVPGDVLAVPDEEPPVLAVVPGPSPSDPPSADPSAARPAAELVAFARRVAAEHQHAHGEPITRDKLRARLGVSNQLASTLLRELRAPT